MSVDSHILEEFRWYCHFKGFLIECYVPDLAYKYSCCSSTGSEFNPLHLYQAAQNLMKLQIPEHLKSLASEGPHIHVHIYVNKYTFKK